MYTILVVVITFILCTGDNVLERVSPQIIVLDPPEKLVIETRASGGYQWLEWDRNGNGFTIIPGQPFTVTLQELPNFFEIFVREPTTTNDLGVYEAELVVDIGQTQAAEIDFAVTPYSECVFKPMFQSLLSHICAQTDTYVHKLIHMY